MHNEFIHSVNPTGWIESNTTMNLRDQQLNCTTEMARWTEFRVKICICFEMLETMEHDIIFDNPEDIR